MWFNEHDDWSRYASLPVDLLEFMNSSSALDARLSPFKNGVIELTRGLDVVYDALDKGFKYEVRRAEKENIVCQELKDLRSPTLQDIFRMYRAFSLEKKIPVTPLQFFELYANANTLKVSTATLGNDVVQYHIYFSSAEERILLASFPDSRSAGLKKSVIGYANRSLHWFDIQKSHEAGVKKYNLGGIGNFPNAEMNGIAKFKKEMSPETEICYHGIIPRSVLGKILLNVKTWVKRYV